MHEFTDAVERQAGGLPAADHQQLFEVPLGVPGAAPDPLRPVDDALLDVEADRARAQAGQARQVLQRKAAAGRLAVFRGRRNRHLPAPGLG